MELQLFLIWNNAIEYFPDIIGNLACVFKIKAVYETFWNKDKTLQKM